MLLISMPVENSLPLIPPADENVMVDDLRLLMERHGIRHLPIVRGNRVVGVISDRLRLFSA